MESRRWRRSQRASRLGRRPTPTARASAVALRRAGDRAIAAAMRPRLSGSRQELDRLPRNGYPTAHANPCRFRPKPKPNLHPEDCCRSLRTLADNRDTLGRVACRDDLTGRPGVACFRSETGCCPPRRGRVLKCWMRMRLPGPPRRHVLDRSCLASGLGTHCTNARNDVSATLFWRGSVRSPASRLPASHGRHPEAN